MKARCTFVVALGFMVSLLLIACTSGDSGGGVGAPIAALPGGDELAPGGGSPAEIAAKAAAAQDIIKIQNSMNDMPELALTAEDLAELESEGLLASPTQLEGWVK